MGDAAAARERIKVREAALITGETERTLQAMALRGEIPGAAKPGKCWTFDEARLRRWMRERRHDKELTEEITARRAAKARGVIYFVRCGGLVKIGYTRRGVRERLASLQTGSPEQHDLVAVLKGPRGREQAIHGQFSAFRVRGEWFRLEGDLAAYVARIARPRTIAKALAGDL